MDSPDITIAVNFWWQSAVSAALRHPSAAFLLRESLRSLTQVHLDMLMQSVQPFQGFDAAAELATCSTAGRVPNPDRQSLATCGHQACAADCDMQQALPLQGRKRRRLSDAALARTHHHAPVSCVSRDEGRPLEVGSSTSDAFLIDQPATEDEIAFLQHLLQGHAAPCAEYAAIPPEQLLASAGQQLLGSSADAAVKALAAGAALQQGGNPSSPRKISNCGQDAAVLAPKVAFATLVLLRIASRPQVTAAADSAAVDAGVLILHR